jgi:hypothetical protein
VAALKAHDPVMQAKWRDAQESWLTLASQMEAMVRRPKERLRSGLMRARRSWRLGRNVWVARWHTHFSLSAIQRVPSLSS